VNTLKIKYIHPNICHVVVTSLFLIFLALLVEFSKMKCIFEKFDEDLNVSREKVMDKSGGVLLLCVIGSKTRGITFRSLSKATFLFLSRCEDTNIIVRLHNNNSLA
jgi:hypothetical protein